MAGDAEREIRDVIERRVRAAGLTDADVLQLVARLSVERGLGDVTVMVRLERSDPHGTGRYGLSSEPFDTEDARDVAEVFATNLIDDLKEIAGRGGLTFSEAFAAFVRGGG